MNKTTSEQTLVAIATTVYEYFQSAKEDLNHATNSREARYSEGQCDTTEKLMGEVYNLISESIHGKELMEQIQAYEREAEKFREKQKLIVGASDYELSLVCEDDEYFIETVIEELESKGIEITMDNFDTIADYVKNQLYQEKTDFEVAKSVVSLEEQMNSAKEYLAGEKKEKEAVKELQR